MAGGTEPQDVDAVISSIGLGRFQFIIAGCLGCVYMSEMMEVQLLTILGHHLQCEWRLDEVSKASIASFGFFGLLVGDLVFGLLSDRLGRRDVFSLGALMLFLYGSLTSLAPSLHWLLCLCWLQGFWIGACMPALMAYGTEVMPTRHRGSMWYLQMMMWSTGGLVVQLLAWAVMYRVANDWRLLSFLAALPLAAAGLFACLWLPRSPRFCLQHGCHDEAVATVQRIARANGQPPFEGKLAVSDADDEAGNLLLMFHPQVYLRLTILLTIVVTLIGFCYYSVIQLTMQIPLLQAESCASHFSSQLKQPSNCRRCERLNFAQLIPPSLADPIGNAVAALVLDRLPSRRLLLLVCLCVTAALSPLLSICMPTALWLAVAAAVRMGSAVLVSVSQLLLCEYYPTSLRASAVATSFFVMRVSVIVSPFVTQVFVTKVSLLGGCLIVSALMLATCGVVALLPYETKDRPLTQTIGQGHGAAAAPMLRAGDGDEAGDYGSVSKSKDR